MKGEMPNRLSRRSVAIRVAARAIPFLMVTALSCAAGAENLLQKAPLAPTAFYDSFQIRHVAITALVHVLSLGIWPKSYGGDLHRIGPYLSGWTPEQVEMLLPHARRAYIGWIDVWYFLISAALVAVGIKLVISALRCRMRASERNTTREGA
ncbi:hypothetical protein [Burkholderia gladioli]|uniref:hypothetical protein n=1 Tax=Burkholderia gladioli TaxID=28095 RepID=UPI000FD80B89|nr:hypothetical protein [Burkholderia gladioli]